MRYCVTCGVSNWKTKFIGIQCENCNELLGEKEYTPTKEDIQKYLKRVYKPVKKEKRKRECLKCGGKVKHAKQICDKCREILKVRKCKCGNVLARYERKCSTCKSPKQALTKTAFHPILIKKCLVCGDIEIDSKPFKINKRGYKLSRHEGCSSEKVKPKKIKELRNTIVENLHEEKICSKCQNKKPLKEFYFHKTKYEFKIYYYEHCKLCHHKLTRKYALDHREKILKYQREYQKTYKRKKN